MLSFAAVSLGRGGLPSCRVCSPSESVVLRPTSEVLVDVRQCVRTWTQGPGPNVSLTGADAFGHSELPALVSQCVSAGVSRLRLTTAGAVLSHAANAGGSIDAGVRHVEVVALSAAQGLEPLSAAPSFAAVLDGIGAYLDAGRERGAAVALVARVLACPHTYDSVPTTVAALGNAGALAVTVELIGATRPEPAWARSVVDSGVVNRAWVTIEDSRGGIPSSIASDDPLSASRAWYPV